MDQDNSPATEDAADPDAAPHAQRELEILRAGRLDSTYIDVSRQGPLLSEEEFLDESGD